MLKLIGKKLKCVEAYDKDFKVGAIYEVFRDSTKMPVVVDDSGFEWYNFSQEGNVVKTDRLGGAGAKFEIVDEKQLFDLAEKKIRCIKTRNGVFKTGEVYDIFKIDDLYAVRDDYGCARHIIYESESSTFIIEDITPDFFGVLSYAIFKEVEQPPISIGESSAGLNGMLEATTKAHTRTAKKTFDNAKFVLASIYAANPISTKTQVTERIGFVLDSCISQICHLMDWNYELHFDLIYDYIVNKNRSCFADLQFEIEGIEEE